MRKLKSIFLLMLMAIVPLQSIAAEEESKELDIPDLEQIAPIRRVSLEEIFGY